MVYDATSHIKSALLQSQMKFTTIFQNAMNQHAELPRNCGLLQAALRCDQSANDQTEYKLTLEEERLSETTRSLHSLSDAADIELKTLRGELASLKKRRQLYMTNISKIQTRIRRIKRDGFMVEDSESADGSALAWAEKQHAFFCGNAEAIRSNERKVEQDIETVLNLMSDVEALIAPVVSESQHTNVLTFPSPQPFPWDQIFDEVTLKNADAILAQIQDYVTPCDSLSHDEYVDEVRNNLSPDDLYCVVYEVIEEGGEGLGELAPDPFFFWLETNTREVTPGFKALRKVLCDNLSDIKETTCTSQPESRWEMAMKMAA